MPEGSRLLHIGPHKTGTTAIQAAFWAARAATLDQGVRYAGRSRHPSQAARAVTARSGTYSHDAPPIREWHRLLSEVRSAPEPRVVISSELFAWAADDAIRRIVADLDPGRIEVVVTLRPLSRILPSMWQQNVQAGSVTPFPDWLARLLADRQTGQELPFWRLHRHDRLIERWADVAGTSRVIAVVVDDRDHGAALRAFETLTALGPGTLAAMPDLANRSLTLGEAEAVRAFNVAFAAALDDRALYARIMRLGAAQQMKLREPGPDEARISLPTALRPRVHELELEVVRRIGQLGIRVVGDLELLAPQVGDDEDEAPGLDDGTRVSAEVAGAMAMGVLEAAGAARMPEGAARKAGTGASRRGTARGPSNRDRPSAPMVPGYQVAAVIALRALEAARARADQAARWLIGRGVPLPARLRGARWDGLP